MRLGNCFYFEGKERSMLPGFLGTRASLMLDVVFLAMFAVIPVMAWSIYLVKYRQRYALHKTLQLTLGAVLLVAVTAFEVDMRIYGWYQLADPSPYFDAQSPYAGGVFYSLCIHLFFAVTTAVLWVVVIVNALRKFPNPVGPNEHSPSHIRWARLAAWDMVGTAVTGWIFYWLAFVA